MFLGLEEPHTLFSGVVPVRAIDDALCTEQDVLFFLELFVFNTTLIAFDTPDCENSFLRGEEPGGLRIIGKEEPTKRSS